MIKLGTSDMAKAYVGSSEVSKMYLGNDLVYSKGSDSLPEDYVECDYILTGGSAFINSGINATPTTSIWMDAYIPAINNQDRLWSERHTFYYVSYINGSGQWALMFSNVSSQYLSTGVAATAGRHTFYLDATNKKYLIDDGDTVNYDLSQLTATNNSTGQIYLFRDSTNSTSVGHLLCFGCKIWQNGVIERNYIPVYKKSIDVYGMYDKVHGVFYGSSSSYGFSGRIKVNLPDGYTKALYIETTKEAEGVPHIQDTNIPISLNFKVTMDFSITQLIKRMFLLAWEGNLADDSIKYLADVYVRNSNDCAFAYTYGDTQMWKSTGKKSDQFPHFFKIDSVNEIFSMDDGGLYSESLSSYPNENELVRQSFLLMQMISAKCYNANVWIGSNHFAHYIPCLNPNNVYGLYNVIGNYFITTNTGVINGELL